VERLHARGLQVVLIGAPNELEYVDSLQRALPEAIRRGVTNTAGKLSLGELFALLERAACVVTNDTGPMHIALALERPTVCLFGPGSPEHYGVFRDDSVVFHQNLICSPCIYETDEPPCNGNNVCMQMIEPDSVAEAVFGLLARKPLGRAAQQRRLLPVVSAGASVLGVVTRDSISPSR
jgi:ADP-heptose:LPS heptosyltransferase